MEDGIRICFSNINNTKNLNKGMILDCSLQQKNDLKKKKKNLKVRWIVDVVKYELNQYFTAD